MDTIIKILILFTIFTPAIDSGLPIEFVEMVIGLLFVMFLLNYTGYPKPILAILGTLLAVGTYHVFQGNNTMFGFGKVYMSTAVAMLLAYSVLRYFKFNTTAFVKLYLTGTFIMACIGLVQLLSYYIGFHPGYDFSWFLNNHRLAIEDEGIRLNAFFGEPSVIGQVFAPAFVFSACRILGIRPFFLGLPQAILICFIYLASLSSLAFVGILIAGSLIVFQYLSLKKLILAIALVIGIVSLARTFNSGFKQRLKSATIVATESDLSEFNHSIDASTYTVFNNLTVAYENWKRHPWTGTGLGSHEIAFNKYSLGKTNELFAHIPEYNYNDAGSLLVRTFSEMGLMGIIFFFFYSIKNFVKRRPGISNKFWIISMACLCILLVSFIRKGHYFNHGILLFLCLYYYNKKDFLEEVERQKEKIAADKFLSI